MLVKKLWLLVLLILLSIGGLYAFDRNAEGFKVYNWYEVNADITNNINKTTVTTYNLKTKEYGAVFVAFQSKPDTLMFGIYYNSGLNADAVRNIYMTKKDQKIVAKGGTLDHIYVHREKEFALFVENKTLYLGVLPKY